MCLYNLIKILKWKTGAQPHTHTHTHTHIYIYIYTYIYVRGNSRSAMLLGFPIVIVFGDDSGD